METKQFEIPVWVSACRGNEKNCRYPDGRIVTYAEELQDAVSQDHTFIEFRDHYRNEENFLSAKCLVVDCDNSHSDEEKDWIWVEQIQEAFPGVSFVIYTSRNHEKKKGKQTARPRFHVIFPIDEVTEPAGYKELLRRVQDYFPFFDSRAQDAARFFFGNPDARIVMADGWMNLSKFFRAEDAFADMGEEIEEGRRNATLFHAAVCLMKRYGHTDEAKKRFLVEADKCNPHLERDELRTIWKSADRYYKKIALQPGYVSPEAYNGTAPAKWEEPIPLSKCCVAQFPLDALPKPVEDYVEAVAESAQAPVDMAASVALSMISVAAQGKYRIQGKRDWTEPLNSYILVIAPPSERKSAVLHAMVRPLYEYEKDYNKRNSAAVESSRMGKRILERRQKMLEEQIAKGKAEEKEKHEIAAQIAEYKEIKPMKLYVDDITTEKLASVLSDNDGRAAIISSEGGIFDTLAGIYTKTVNIDVMLKGYSGDVIRVDRIGRDSETILNPVLTILLMTQPNVISEVLSNSKFRGRGLTARFLYCMPVSSVGKRKFMSAPVEQEVYREYEMCLKNILEDEYPEQPEIITLSREAEMLLSEFSEELEPKILTEYKEIADWVGKLVGNTLRIAGLLCRAGVRQSHDFLDVNEPLVVDEETMTKAIKVGRYYLSHAQAAFSTLPGEAMYQKAVRVLQMIKENGFTEFNRRTAMHKCRSFKTVEEIQPVLDFLEDYGYIQQKPLETAAFTGRRPLPKYEVNPWVHEH
jgi:hypothetical protein